MIAYLRGKVLTTTLETAIIDVNGVGYEVYCSGGAFKKLVVGQVGELHTYLQVKEDGITLFGFADPKEKELFLKLITVSGIRLHVLRSTPTSTVTRWRCISRSETRLFSRHSSSCSVHTTS